jgi:hypothetical protein
MLHHQHLTPSQRLAVAHQTRFRANIEARAEARKVVPIVCADKPVQVGSEVVGPRIKSEEEIAFGPIVHREPPEPRRPGIKLIQKAVCRFYEITAIDMLSDRRNAPLVMLRQTAMYLCKTMTLKSLPEIGRQFGGRDHTTVLHAVRKIEARVAEDDRLADEIEVLKLHIRQATLNQ